MATRPSAFRRRRRVVLVGLFVLFLFVAVQGVRHLLPWWKPDWVMKHSPWFELSLRATAYSFPEPFNFIGVADPDRPAGSFGRGDGGRYLPRSFRERWKKPKSLVPALTRYATGSDSLLRLAALAALRDFAPHLGPRSLVAFRKAATARDERYRRLALEGIYRQGSDEAIELLTLFFADPSPTIRKLAIHALDWGGWESFGRNHKLSSTKISVLFEGAAAAAPEVRRFCAREIRRVPEFWSEEKIISSEELRNLLWSTDATVRASAWHVLEPFADRGRFSASFYFRLATSPASEIRHRVLKALRTCLSTSDRLRDFCRAPDDRQRFGALRYFAGIDEGKGLARTLEGLRKGLSHERPGIRATAVEGLGPHLERNRRRPFLLEALSDPSEAVRVAGFRVARLNPVPEEGRPFVDALFEQPVSPALAGAAARLFGRIGDRASIDALKRLAESDEPAIRAAAHRGVAGLGAVGRPLLVQGLQDPDETVRMAVLETLPAVAHPDLFEPLDSFLDKELERLEKENEDRILSFGSETDDRELDLFLGVIDVLAKIRKPKATERLLDFLEDDRVAVRLQVVRALGKRQDEESRNRLRERVRWDRKTEVRMAGLRALARRKAPGLSELVAELLKDMDDDMLEKLPFFLASRPYPGAWEQLVRLAHDRDYERRRAALPAVARMESYRAHLLLWWKQRDPEPWVHEKARELWAEKEEEVRRSVRRARLSEVPKRDRKALKKLKTLFDSGTPEEETDIDDPGR